LLVFDVVEFRSFSSADLISIAEEFWVFGVVVAHGQALTEQLPEEWERAERGDQCNFERVPE
jgi:hypothetical protein